MPSTVVPEALNDQTHHHLGFPLAVASHGPSMLSFGATTWCRDRDAFANLCSLPGDATEGAIGQFGPPSPVLMGKDQAEGSSKGEPTPIRRPSTMMFLPPAKEPPTAESPLHRRCPLALTMALGPGVLLCIVGFLAWGVPFANLSSQITPLAEGICDDVLSSIAMSVEEVWRQMRARVMEQQLRWNITGQSTDPFLQATAIGRDSYPILAFNPIAISAPVVMMKGECVLMGSLQNYPQYGWCMNRQNCTDRWLEAWDNTTQTLTGQVLITQPLLNVTSAYLTVPVNGTTPAQPFTWMSYTYNPIVGDGDTLTANIGLFDPVTEAFVGRAGLTISTQWLQTSLQAAVERQWATSRGKAILYEEGGLVVAATVGVPTSPQRIQFSQLTDPDLIQAIEMVQAHGGWCAAVSKEVALSQRYFLNTLLISDPNPSVQSLSWCALLLAPRSNTMAPVDRSLVFAVIFVCVMTVGITAVSLVFGVLVTRPLLQLTRGMQALKQCDFAAARAAVGQKSVFAELVLAQDSYDALVETIDAFGKYVPQAVVQGLLDGSIRPALGMVPVNIAVAFMDIENFTTLCETIGPDDIVHVTCTLFDKCCGLILNSGGSIDKFLGDCIMAVWGAPLPLPVPGRNAVAGVLDILHALAGGLVCTRTGERLRLRIGLHGGPCLVGNFGATARWDYTAYIGDAVNIAARLEPLNQQFGTHCLTSGTVYDQLATYPALQRCMRPMGNVLLVGKWQPVRVYELSDAPVEDLEGWAAAMQHYEDGRLEAAAEHFSARTGDPAAVALLREIPLMPPGANGSLRVMKSK